MNILAMLFAAGAGIGVTCIFSGVIQESRLLAYGGVVIVVASVVCAGALS